MEHLSGARAFFHRVLDQPSFIRNELNEATLAYFDRFARAVAASARARVGLALIASTLTLCSASAAAQIQLAPPVTQKPTWTAQLAPSTSTPEEKAAPAPQETTPAAQQTTQPAPQPAAPQKPAPPDFSIVDRATGVESAPTLESWTNKLNDIEQTLNSAFVSYTLLDRARGELEEIRAEIDKFLQILTPKVEEAKAQVDNLGPVPESGDPEPVAAQRAELQKVYGSLSATKNIADSAKLRISQLAGKIQEIRRRKFAERLFEHVPEAHSAYTWENAPQQFSFALQKAWASISNWWEHLDRRSDAIQILIVGFLIAIGTGFASARGVRHFRRWKYAGAPPYWRRSTSAAWVTLLRVLPYAATSAFLYYSFRYQGLMSEAVDPLAYSTMRSLLIVTAVCALAATVLSPRRANWRLLPIDDRAAKYIRWLVVALAAMYSFTLFIDTVRYVSNAPFTLTVAQGFVSSIVIALLVMAILMTPSKPMVLQEGPEFRWIGMLRWPLWGVALIILLTALAGYIGLARFITAQLIVTGTVVGVLYLLMIWVDAVGESMGNEQAKLGQWLKAKASLDQRRREQLSLPVTLLLKSAVLLFTVPLILLQWGFDWKDISEWGNSLFFGFKIGQTEISIAAIIASIVVFILGYLFARIFQGWLDRRVLETAGMSGGARHSIRTAVGYVGIIIAAIVAVSYAGLDLSSIALVAGALSVGIGLGLQGVVNNFVSGLILLVERPIKVGDWVVVGGEEGIVKRISVRATEIETFDRANVLIPNAFFISEKVKNWTLHNYSGRVAILVGVHYASNPRQVHDILLKVAKANPKVMANPEPFVYFGDFAADALEFTLYAYAYDITKSLALRTELRMSIVEDFQKAGIEIPYRQTDVHLRDADWIKDFMLSGFAQPQASEPQSRPRRHRRRAGARKKIRSPQDEIQDAAPVPAGRNGGNGSARSET